MKILNIFFILLVSSLIFLPSLSSGQLISVKGYIFDASTGKHLEEASVYENYSDVGTISNKEGYFVLLLNPGSMNFTITDPDHFVLNKEFTLDSDTLIYIHLNSKKTFKNELNKGDNQLGYIPFDFIHSKKEQKSFK